MTNAACPDDDTLAAFVERRSERAEEVEEHIDTCADCRVTVAHLAAMAFGERSGDRTAPPIALNVGPREEVPVGERISRYVVRREIGRGAMGVVVAAYDPELDREVALKIVRPTGDREHVLREARTMARFAHPNVVTIHDVGDLGDGRVFLAMELVRGATLRTVLRDRRPARPDLFDLFVQAGRGLAAAHAAGIVHRDFKPDNVLVGNDGRVRVTDFGLARPADDVAAADVAGTPVYMAPEQHAGRPATPRSDQFAFAVALFEALTEKRPFAGTTYEEIVRAKRAGTLTPWPESASVPKKLTTAIERALSVDPEARYASMEDLVALLVPQAPSRRGSLVFGGAIAVVLAVALGLTFGRAKRPAVVAPPPCAVLAPSVPRADLERDLHPKNKDTLSSVLGALEQHASAIANASEAACKAPSEARASTQACLVRRQSELDGVIAVLPGMNGDFENVLVLEPLGDVPSCAHASTALPDEQEKRRLALEVYRDVASIRANPYGPKRYAMLDEVAKKADASGHGPAGGEVALLRAEVLTRRQSFEEAIAIAQATRDDDLAARAWRARVRHDRRRGDSDLAAHVAAAIGAIDRVGRPDWKADVLEWRARDDLEEARFRAAHDALDQAKRLRAIVPPLQGRNTYEDDLLRVECLLEDERNDDASAALYRAEQAIGERPSIEIEARLLSLAGRVAFALGKVDEALTKFARAQELALEEQRRYTTAKNAANGIAPSDATARRHVARHAFIEAALWSGRAQLSQRRFDVAAQAFESVVVEARSAGVNIEPLAEVRAIAELARLQRTQTRSGDPKRSPLVRASRSVTFLEGRNSPLVGEALLAQGEALVAEGRPRDAIAILSRAERLTTEGSPEAHVDCIIALHRAAKAAQDTGAASTAESAARLASVSALFGPQTPSRKKLAAEFDFRR